MGTTVGVCGFAYDRELHGPQQTLISCGHDELTVQSLRECTSALDPMRQSMRSAGTVSPG